MDRLAKAFSETRQRVVGALARAGRDPDDVRLIAVSKRQPPDQIAAIHALGQLEFGENYVQEWLEKRDHFVLLGTSKIRWHLIGPLQRNKVKFVVGQCELIQTVDRFELAQEIAKVAVERNVIQEVLIQVRIGNEGTKHGVPPDQARELLDRVESLPGLRARGMMVLPPLAEAETEARRFLRESRVLFERLKTAREGFSVLSMGTSHDFEWAIEEGATMVRVGTVIFGSRI